VIGIHLYGKLRRFAAQRDARSDSIVSVPWREGDTVGAVARRIGIPREELGSNLFRNGRYATIDSPIADGDRLGLFPDDMQLLYKWYFAPTQAAAKPSPGPAEPNLKASGSGSVRPESDAEAEK